MPFSARPLLLLSSLDFFPATRRLRVGLPSTQESSRHSRPRKTRCLSVSRCFSLCNTVRRETERRPGESPRRVRQRLPALSTGRVSLPGDPPSSGFSLADNRHPSRLSLRTSLSAGPPGLLLHVRLPISPALPHPPLSPSPSLHSLSRVLETESAPLRVSSSPATCFLLSPPYPPFSSIGAARQRSQAAHLLSLARPPLSAALPLFLKFFLRPRWNAGASLSTAFADLCCTFPVLDFIFPAACGPRSRQPRGVGSLHQPRPLDGCRASPFVLLPVDS